MTATINASTSSGVVTSADTSGALALQSNGTTKLTVDSTGAYGQLVSGTAVASTSGTSIDFTGIPSWVKRITVLFNEVSLSGTSAYLIRVGNSGGFSSSGYISTSNHFNQSNGTAGSNNTTGFLLWENTASDSVSGKISLDFLSGTLWVYSSLFKNATTLVGIGAGTTNIATLDRVRITTVNGTDTFDAGSINILYEG
jgi:hypothetical protein